MSEELKRVQIGEEEGEYISGGTLRYSDMRKVAFSTENPNVKYTFNCRVVDLINYESSISGDDATKLQMMVDAGLIWPL